MEQGTRLALVLVGVTSLLLGTFVAVSYAQIMFRTSGQGWFGQMMSNNGGMGMTGGGHMDGMGGMMGGMSDHCQGSGPGPGNYSAANTVVISNYSFNQQTLKVRVGTTVTWINMDTVTHSLESGTHEAPTGLFESALLNHMQSFSYTFKAPGTFVYHCDPHPYMTGTILVE